MDTLFRPQASLHFQSAAGKLFYHPAGYLHMVWNPERLPLDTLQLFYEQALQLMRGLGTGKLLTEHGQRAPLVAAAQEWLTHSWIPRAVQQVNFRHCAIVEGQDPLHRLSTQSVLVEAPQEVEFRRFTSLAEAESWLRKAA